jgi:CheY-like chemotaxis protein
VPVAEVVDRAISFRAEDRFQTASAMQQAVRAVVGAPKPAPTSVDPSRRIKILVVEDEELNRDMLGRRLMRVGFEVAVALDGEQAISMTRSQRPAIVLMDMSLPVMDGWEATRRIKADPELSAIPIVALTAHAMPADRERAMKAGCDDFESKPVDFRQLMGKIESWLARPNNPKARAG